ncbi:MAG: RHS repeat-associated core domain-containing protein [Bacteroidales bacterium]|nr:RHS repeat-associated core domain-containing protein [Bacteroidales bacterium]
MIYVYDAEGSPVGFRYRNSTYYSGIFDNYIYGKNVQGDIIYIFNIEGNKVAEFAYDAWGNPVSTNYYNSGSNPGVTYSPFRYRGYWYDEETGLYYLNSRYYNPEWGRFLNADIYLNANGDIIGHNLFAYCGNEPTGNVDPLGYLAFPGEIHNEVEKHLKKIYGWNSEQRINYENGTWGRADLISSNGEVWEIKRDKPKQIERGKDQVKKYVDNTWKNQPKKKLSIGQYIESNSFTYKSGDTTYNITYRYAGDGVIAYDYSTKVDWERVGEKALATTLLAATIIAAAYSYGATSPALVYSFQRYVEAFS